MDAAYLENTVAAALVQALAATVEFQPDDSVDFLGRYLLKYADNEEKKAVEKAKAAQAEADLKEAAAKAAVAAGATQKAAAQAAAQAKGDAELIAKLEGGALTPALFTDVLNQIQKTTGATGVYVAVKNPSPPGDDADGAPASLSYTAASTDHAYIVGKTLTQPNGVTFDVWVRPPAPEVEDEVDEDGNVKPKPPPPELEPLVITNILKASSAEFFGIPKLGAFLAVPFEFTTLSIPPPPEDGAAVEGVPAGVPTVRSGAIVLDTIGQNRPFTEADIAVVKGWKVQVAAALNKQEAAKYQAAYAEQQEKAKAAPAPTADAGDSKEEA